MEEKKRAIRHKAPRRYGSNQEVIDECRIFHILIECKQGNPNCDAWEPTKHPTSGNLDGRTKPSDVGIEKSAAKRCEQKPQKAHESEDNELTNAYHSF